MTAIAGGILGFLLAYAVILGGLPRLLRGAADDLLRRRLELRRHPARAGVHLHARATWAWSRASSEHVRDQHPYASGFTLYSKLGLEIVYLYFQFPLMVLIIAPAIDGLKREWREAAENMGASPRQYWRYVALPDPDAVDPRRRRSCCSATRSAPRRRPTSSTGGVIPIVTVLIGAQISGDVLHNPGLGYALAMGMVVIMGSRS